MPSYKYLRSAYRRPPAQLTHADLDLRFFDDHVDGTEVLSLTPRSAIDRLTLDSQDLEIPSVEFRAGQTAWATVPSFTLRREANALDIALPRELAVGEAFELRVRAVCRPTSNVLDGLYYDTTPAGAPPQMISQCQQWGFQRILPIVDDCTAKCTWRTRLEADARYTHLVTNGDVCRETNPDGVPVPVPAPDGAPARKAITYVNDIPMPPYLFLVAVGTWDCLADSVTLPSGRAVRLEYLVPPGQLDGARLPMEILKDSVLWHARTLGYEYRRDCYRTICMEKSNFGGMENVGNTTIITEAALLDEWTSDRRIVYAHGVILHEFEHNHCGSDVTMETPFDMWLNEAYTVNVERAYLRSVFDPALVRLDEIDAVRAPLGGPLATEDGGRLGRIVREGFNHPDEVVDGLTYDKAPEVLSMLERILGPETYRAATELYFRRHNGGNASTDQFLACFEEASGRDLSQFFREWLFTVGYPEVEARHSYDPGSRTLSIRLRQTRRHGDAPFHVPVTVAAVGVRETEYGPRGVDLAGSTAVLELRRAEQSFTLHDVAEPAYLSFNRGMGFYGVFRDLDATPAQLALQAKTDPDPVSRVEAFRALTDAERIRLVDDPSLAAPSKAWLSLFAELLVQPGVPPGVRAALLGIGRQSLDRAYLPRPVERLAAWRTLVRSAAKACGEAALIAAFDSVDTLARRPARDGIAERQLKGVLAGLLCALGTPSAFDRVERHFREAWNITDKMNAASALLVHGAPGRYAVLDELSELCRPHISAYGGYLALVASDPSDEVYARIDAETRRAPFRLDHPGHSRSLFAPFAANDAQLWTPRGLAWMEAAVLRLAPLNEYTANRLLAAFQLVSSMPPAQRDPATAMLRRLQSALPGSCASVQGRIASFL